MGLTERLLQDPSKILYDNGVVRRVVVWRDRSQLRQHAKPFPANANIGVCITGHAQDFDTIANANPSVGCTNQSRIAMQGNSLIPHIPVRDDIRVEARSPILQILSPVNVVTRTVEIARKSGWRIMSCEATSLVTKL